VLIGNKNGPDINSVANPKDAKRSLSDFFTSTVGSIMGVMPNRIVDVPLVAVQG